MTTRTQNMDTQDIESVRSVVLRTGLLLDQGDLTGWLAHFESDGVYELRAYSTEIRQWMTWWLATHGELEKTLSEVVQHVCDPAQRRHVIGAPVVTQQGSNALAVSPFSIFRTSPDGVSSLYMVGRYEDTLAMREGVWRITSRIVVTDTRVLDMFTHIPV
jgi:3-phenylpropionate/cinnamic acid dioxygenase small subunit